MMLCSFSRDTRWKRAYSARGVKENLHRRGKIWAKFPWWITILNGGKEGGRSCISSGNQ